MKYSFHSFLLGMAIFLTSCAGNLGQLTTAGKMKESFSDSTVKFDDSGKSAWDENFEVVGIPSNLDAYTQKAYFYKSRHGQPRPLVVSLHTWSGDYQQKDPLAELCESEDINYIHPDFRGPNISKDAFGSELAMNDID